MTINPRLCTFVGAFPTRKAAQLFQDALADQVAGPASQHKVTITKNDAKGYTLEVSQCTGSLLEGLPLFYRGWVAHDVATAKQAKL